MIIAARHLVNMMSLRNSRLRRLLARSLCSSPPVIPRVAVVGAGPAGFYASQHILKNLPESRIDIFEALPVPFGLVRYDQQFGVSAMTSWLKVRSCPGPSRSEELHYYI